MSKTVHATGAGILLHECYAGKGQVLKTTQRRRGEGGGPMFVEVRP